MIGVGGDSRRPVERNRRFHSASHDLERTRSRVEGISRSASQHAAGRADDLGSGRNVSHGVGCPLPRGSARASRHHRGEGIRTIDPAESIYLVPVDAQGPTFSDEDDNATAVVVVE